MSRGAVKAKKQAAQKGTPTRCLNPECPLVHMNLENGKGVGLMTREQYESDPTMVVSYEDLPVRDGWSVDPLTKVGRIHYEDNKALVVGATYAGRRMVTVLVVESGGRERASNQLRKAHLNGARPETTDWGLAQAFHSADGVREFANALLEAADEMEVAL